MDARTSYERRIDTITLSEAWRIATQVSLNREKDPDGWRKVASGIDLARGFRSAGDEGTEAGRTRPVLAGVAPIRRAKGESA